MFGRNKVPWQLAAKCGCGHPAAMHDSKHKDGHLGGCRSKAVLLRRTDPYGYCTCPQTQNNVLIAYEL